MAMGTNIKVGHAGRLQAMLNRELGFKRIVRNHIHPKRKIFYKAGEPTDSQADDEQNAVGDFVINTSAPGNAFISVGGQNWTEISEV